MLMQSTNQTAHSSSVEAPSDDERRQQVLKERGEIPEHVACIMDGNGRWAQRRGQSRVIGHQEGVASVRKVTEACAELGVDYLTLYTFSTENWERPEAEVDALMKLLIHTVEEEKARLMENDIRLRTIGSLSKLPRACQDVLTRTKKETASNTRMTLTLALSYSGRDELVEAARRLAERVEEGELDAGDIDEAEIENHLDTADMPDPDLMIRTGGEYRLSNFLLWQSAYTELYITDRFWPDFRRDALYGAIRSYQGRERRYGRIEESAYRQESDDPK